MYGNHGVQRYKETNINSISREKMIVMLYERMQSDLLGAAKAIGADDRVEMTRLVNHSQRIVSELRGALDHTIGGEVSRNLESLYDYLFHEHLQVLVDQDEAHIRNSL
ncbi:flagellar export chaperone FliS, partial [bacterium DOLZORAL124_64_63]